jgi:hypothetical protein
MKRITLLLAAILMITTAYSQPDSTAVKVLKKNVVTVTEDTDKTQVRVGEEKGVEVVTNHAGDTTSIRIGNRTFDVIGNGEGTKIHMSREENEKPRKRGNFESSWGGFGMGVNTFHTADYSLYNGTELGEFFDINHNKSLSVNINFAEYAFSDNSNTIALVTGLGFNFMDFRFDEPITVTKEAGTGRLIPVLLDGDVSKSKLSVSYLTAPLILELATPLKYKSNRLTLGAGVIGGLNIGSHTKIKTGDTKSKERRNFNINPVKYELTGRIGFGDIAVFANYGMTSLFKDEKGPDLRPLTIGLHLNM